jgi:hypothetical protein
LGNINEIWVYDVGMKLGPYLQGPKIESQFTADVVNISSELPVEGMLIFDLRDVNLVSPVLIINIVKHIEKESKKRKKSLFRGKFCSIKDPNEDVKMIVLFSLKKMLASMISLYTDKKDQNVVCKFEILNLPNFLQETLDIIKEHGPISSSDLAKHIDPANPGNTRERLRQLFRRGLVKRQGIGTTQGERFFMYQALTLSSLTGARVWK